MIEYNEKIHIAILRQIIKLPVHQNPNRCPATNFFLKQKKLAGGWIKKDICSFCKKFHEVSKQDLCPCRVIGEFESRIITLRKLHGMGHLDRQTMIDGIETTLYHQRRLDAS